MGVILKNKTKMIKTDIIARLILDVCFIVFIWVVIINQVRINERFDRLENKIEILNQNKEDERKRFHTENIFYHL